MSNYLYLYPFKQCRNDVWSIIECIKYCVRNQVEFFFDALHHGAFIEQKNNSCYLAVAILPDTLSYIHRFAFVEGKMTVIQKFLGCDGLFMRSLFRWL